MASTEPVRKYSSLVTAQVSVTTATGAKLFGNASSDAVEDDPGTQPVTIHREITNDDVTNPIFVGNSSAVTALTGYEVKAGQTLKLSAPSGVYLGPLYAISSGGTVVASTLQF